MYIPDLGFAMRLSLSSGSDIKAGPRASTNIVRRRHEQLAELDSVTEAACVAGPRQIPAFLRQGDSLASNRVDASVWVYAAAESRFSFRVADGERPVQRLKA
jgi:hypothetical protein